MARIDSLNNFLTDVANSIRTKKGTTDLITPSNFDTEIESIETGGGDVSEYFGETIGSGTSSQAGYVIQVKKVPAFTFSGTSCAYMFTNSYLTNIDLSNFNTSNTTNMSYMFSSCSQLTNIIGIGKLVTNKVTNMSYMFTNNGSNPNLDLSNFDTSNVTNMAAMFAYNYKLQNLNISSFDFSKVINNRYLLADCKVLENLQFGTNLGAGYLTSQSANYSNYTLDVSTCVKLTETSLISILNGLYDIATKGCNAQQCILGSTNLAKLTSEAGQQALAQAQAYGWTVS